METQYWAVQHLYLQQMVEEGGHLAHSVLAEGAEVSLLEVEAHFLVEEEASLGVAP